MALSAAPLILTNSFVSEARNRGILVVKLTTEQIKGDETQCSIRQQPLSWLQDAEHSDDAGLASCLEI